MPIKINFLANVSDVVRGGKDVEKAFDQVADSLDELATAGPKAGDKLGRGIKDGAKDAGTATEKLERKFKDLADTSKRETSKAGDDIGRNVKAGTDKATEGVQEIGRESASTAKESAASFDGSAESIGQAFQEVAANAFAGFGPAGLLAGVAAAAGIGTVFAELDKAKVKTEELNERTAELAQEYIDTGNAGAAGLDFLVDKLKALATETDESKTNLADLKDLADKSGSSYKDLAQAYAGNADGLKDLWREGDRRRQQLEAEADAIDTTTSSGAKAYAAKIKQADAQREYLGYLGQSLSVVKKAAADELLYAQAGGAEAAKKAARLEAVTGAYEDAAAVQQKLVGYLGAAVPVANEAAAAELAYAQAGGPEMDRKVALIENVNTAYDNAAGAAETYIDKESGLFDTGKYLAAMTAKAQALKDYQHTLETSALTPEAKTFIDSQGVEAAATFLAGYKAATPAQKAELNRIWTEGGKTSSGAYGAALRKGIPTSIPGPKVIIDEPNIDAVFRSLQYRASQKKIRFPGAVFTRNGTEVI